MSTAICTLFEGDYHHGVGALINSLHRYGYKGPVEVGYRGNLPTWMSNARTVLRGTSINLRLHQLETKWHLANFKPKFLLDLFGADPAIDRIFYFDPDIVIKCAWVCFEYWVEPGMALVEEIATYGMAYNHPIRRKWMEVASTLGMVIKPSFSQYFNSGFIGVRRSMIPYVQDWLRITEHLPALGIDLQRFMPEGRPHPFCGPDQDAMNIIAMAAEPYLSTIGPEGMDLIPGGFTMSHAVGGTKPWRKKYLLSALKGNRPTLADKEFWANAAAPVPAFTASVIRNRRTTMNFASVIGRFYRR